jgi:hypothetical protein
MNFQEFLRISRTITKFQEILGISRKFDSQQIEYQPLASNASLFEYSNNDN